MSGLPLVQLLTWLTLKYSHSGRSHCRHLTRMYVYYGHVLCVTVPTCIASLPPTWVFACAAARAAFRLPLPEFDWLLQFYWYFIHAIMCVRVFGILHLRLLMLALCWASQFVHGFKQRRITRDNPACVLFRLRSLGHGCNDQRCARAPSKPQKNAVTSPRYRNKYFSPMGPSSFYVLDMCFTWCFLLFAVFVLVCAYFHIIHLHLSPSHSVYIQYCSPLVGLSTSMYLVRACGICNLYRGGRGEAQELPSRARRAASWRPWDVRWLYLLLTVCVDDRVVCHDPDSLIALKMKMKKTLKNTFLECFFLVDNKFQNFQSHLGWTLIRKTE